MPNKLINLNLLDELPAQFNQENIATDATLLRAFASLEGPLFSELKDIATF